MYRNVSEYECMKEDRMMFLDTVPRMLGGLIRFIHHHFDRYSNLCDILSFLA